MRAPAILLTFAITACATEAPTITSSEQHDECEGDKCPQDPVPSCDYCDGAHGCNSECRDDDGHRTTCAEAGFCQSCDVCSPDVPCNEECVDDQRNVTTCETQKPLCLRYDVYCALPVITGSQISDNHEGGGYPGGNGPEAYMYFQSAGGAKSGDYPRSVGQLQFDPQEAWASNFRGPVRVSNERDQWEWTGADISTHTYPFRYGHAERCERVPAGSPRPALSNHTEQVWEDDECWDFVCNPDGDDHVGGFTFQRSHCDAEVFGNGVEAAFSELHSAQVTGDVKRVDYLLWCYSCLSSASGECSNGVDW